MLLKEIFPQLLKRLLLMRRVARICWRFCLDLTFFIVFAAEMRHHFSFLEGTNFFWGGLPDKKKLGKRVAAL